MQLREAVFNELIIKTLLHACKGGIKPDSDVFLLFLSRLPLGKTSVSYCKVLFDEALKVVARGIH